MKNIYLQKLMHNENQIKIDDKKKINEKMK